MKLLSLPRQGVLLAGRILFLALFGLLASCGGGGSATPTATLQTITVTPAQPQVAVGGSEQFTATGNYSDGSTQNLTGQVTWSSATASVATIVNNTGLASAVTAGSTTIMAKSGTVSGSTTLTVTGASVVSIAVTPPGKTLGTGVVQAYTATASFSDHSSKDVTAQSTWLSSDTAVATISATGQATTKGAGSTTISATYSGKSGNTTLTVTAATLVSIAVSPTNPSVPAGTPQPFTAMGSYSDGSKIDVTNTATWKSDNATVATISAAGIATTLANGVTHITATIGAVVSPASTLTVTTGVVSVAVTPVNPNVAKGGKAQFKAIATYSDSTMGDVTGTAIWSSSSTSIATISTTGLATAKTTAGNTSITAKVGNVSSTPSKLTVTPSNYAYVALNATNQVAQFTINSDGTLAAQATATVAAGTGPLAVAVEPFGRYAYVANSQANTLSQYAIQADGTLSPIGTPIATGTFPRSVAVDPTGQYVYVACATDVHISGYTIGADGTLTEMSGSPFPSAGRCHEPRRGPERPVRVCGQR